MTSSRRSVLSSIAATALTGTAAIAAQTSESRAQSPATRQSRATLPSGASSHFVRANGIQMHYVTMGKGPTLLLLHGWPQTWYAWHGVMPRLAERFTVIAPDLRGNGLSEVTEAGYDKRNIAADIRSLIQQAGGGKAHVVAHDMGGKAAYMLAHLHPEVVDKLVLVDCLIPGTENMDALKNGAWHYGFHMAPNIPEMLTQGREREYIEAQIRNWSHRKDAIGEAAITEFASRYAEPGRMTAGFNYYRSLRDDASLAASLRGRKLQMPVMTIGGEFSAGNKLADALQDEATNLTSVIARDSGHFVAEETPDFFVAQVVKFLST